MQAFCKGGADWQSSRIIVLNERCQYNNIIMQPSSPPISFQMYHPAAVAPTHVVVKAMNTPAAPPAPPCRWWIPATIVAVVILAAVIVGGVVGGILAKPSNGVNSTPGTPSSSTPGTPTPVPTPASSAHTIIVQSANTKQEWINLVASAYNSAGFKLSNGQTAAVSVANTGSGLSPSLKPTIWSPNAINWLTLQESTQGSLVSDKASLCPQ